MRLSSPFIVGLVLLLFYDRVVGGIIGDVTGDCFVDLQDIVAVIAGWGPCFAEPSLSCHADLNSDSLVDLFDMIIVLDSWGSVCSSSPDRSFNVTFLFTPTGPSEANVTILSVSNGTAPFTFLWSDGSTSQSFVNATNGTTVRVCDALQVCVLETIKNIPLDIFIKPLSLEWKVNVTVSTQNDVEFAYDGLVSAPFFCENAFVMVDLTLGASVNFSGPVANIADAALLFQTLLVPAGSFIVVELDLSLFFNLVEGHSYALQIQHRALGIVGGSFWSNAGPEYTFNFTATRKRWFDRCNMEAIVDRSYPAQVADLGGSAINLAFSNGVQGDDWPLFSQFFGDFSRSKAASVASLLLTTAAYLRGPDPFIRCNSCDGYVLVCKSTFAPCDVYKPKTAPAFAIYYGFNQGVYLCPRFDDLPESGPRTPNLRPSKVATLIHESTHSLVDFDLPQAKDYVLDQVGIYGVHRCRILSQAGYDVTGVADCVAEFAMTLAQNYCISSNNAFLYFLGCQDACSNCGEVLLKPEPGFVLVNQYRSAGCSGYLELQTHLRLDVCNSQNSVSNKYYLQQGTLYWEIFSDSSCVNSIAKVVFGIIAQCSQVPNDVTVSRIVIAF